MPNTSKPLRYRLLPGDFAVCRLAPEAEEPAWARGTGFCNVTRTANELSIMCPAADVPPEVRAERGWRVLQVVGPFDFDAVGILVSFASPLARAGIPILAAATFDTDYVLVQQGALAKAQQVLLQAGHECVRD